MDNFMDALWYKILTMIQYGAASFDRLLTPLHFFGPAMLIILLALLTVLCTKFLSAHFKTRRYVELEADFNHWMAVREEALQCDPGEKGRRMARNIDQGTLNKAYYDYFFEGLLLSLITTCLPLISMASFINEYYQAERLLALFGRDYIFSINLTGGTPVMIGSLFFYVISLFTIYLSWSVISMKNRRSEKKEAPTTEGAMTWQR